MGFAEKYHHQGIWGYLSSIAKEYGVRNWFLDIAFEGSRVILLSPSHSLRPHGTTFLSGKMTSLLDDYQNVTVISGLGPGSPVQVDLCVGPSVSLTKEQIASWKADFDFLCRYEATLGHVYPSYLPYAAGFSSDLSEVSSLLSPETQASFVFLNGRDGSGRKTVVSSYFLYRYNYRVNLAAVHAKYIEVSYRPGAKGLVIPEVALLDAVTQRRLLSHPGMYDVVFVLSAYPLQALLDRQMLDEKVGSLCFENKYIVPSMKSWSSIESRKQAQGIAALMGYQVSPGRVNLAETFFDLHGAGNHSDSLWLDRIKSGEPLRDVIKELEIEAIKIAHSIVGDSQNKIADYLGISRGSLQHKLRKYELPYGELD